MKESKRWLTKVTLFVAILTLPTLFSGCGTESDEATIYLASVGPESRMEGEFQNGVTLAIEEIEASGALPGVSIQVDYFDDKRDLTTGIKIAQKLAEQGDKYSAVIGHWNASIGIPASTIYNNAGLLNITPMVSSPDLTKPTKEYIFRAVPTDAQEAKTMAVYAAEKGYDAIAICYTDSDYGVGLSKEFEKASAELGIQILDIHSGFVNQAEFDKQYAKWEALGVKAIFIADSLPFAVDLIHQIREKAPEMPILSAGGFSFDDVVSLAGEDSDGIAFISLYYPDQTLDSQIDFNQRYLSKFGQAPDTFLAAKGYECVALLVEAIQKTGSRSSEELAAYLHQLDNWEGIIDSYSFEENGDPKDMKLYVVEVNSGQYRYL